MKAIMKANGKAVRTAVRKVNRSPRSMSSGRARLAGLLAAVLGIAGAAVSVPAADAAPGSGRTDLGDVNAAVGRAGVPGVAWYTDTAHGRVVVTADAKVGAGGIAKIRRAAGDRADILTIRRTNGVFSPLLSAGDAIYGSGYRCSLGFNVVKGSSYYFLTAGHCGKSVPTWYANSAQTTRIGATQDAQFPGDDYALVRYDNTALSHPGGYTAGTAYVGETVTRDGSTTGVHSGKVTALNATVHYRGGGTVRGLIQTTVCAEPGDSGGPLYDGSKALGLTSGGSGDCRSGGVTFFQPVGEALSAYGVKVY